MISKIQHGQPWWPMKTMCGPPPGAPPSMRYIRNTCWLSSESTEACWGFLLWARSSGPDPRFKVMICEENSTSNATEEREARLSSVSQTKGVRVYNTFKMTKEQVFSVETGILEWTNNWLVMVEQGSRLVQDDCMVCLAPRPLLRMVPVPSELNATCIANIMANNVPSDESKQWGKIYPLTGPADQKPLFSTKVALGNFTCINGTRNSTNKLGNFNAAWCVSYIITNGSLGKMCSDVWWYCGNKVLRGNLPLNFTFLCSD